MAATPDLGARKLTPMLRQFVDAKQECPEGAILLFRMGDFYETFFEDAQIAARELDITLTSRDKGSADPIPMAGVPWHSIGGYIAKLVHRGYTVAICDQVEDPKAAKGIVRREITQIVTPGTVSDLEALDPQSSSYLAWLESVPEHNTWRIALLDLLAGEVLVTRAESSRVLDELRRAGVREAVCSADDAEQLPFDRKAVSLPVRAVREPAPEEGAKDALIDRFGEVAIDGLDVDETEAFLRPLHRLLCYAENTQRRTLAHLMPPRAYRLTDALVLDEATRRNLELTTTMRENKRHGSLLWHLDRCRTSMGSRRLAQWLLFPLRRQEDIDARLDTVERLKNDRTLRASVRESLDGVRDMERLVGRVAVHRATPKDLALLRDSLAQVPEMQSNLSALEGALGREWTGLDPAQDVREELGSALVEDPPTPTGDGGIFARGYREDLDELIALSTEGHDYLRDLELRERERTGIPNLKVRYNKVFGYYLEVTRAHLERVPEDFIRKQTLVNAERFITDELKSYESKVLGADERRKGREQELFETLVEYIGLHLSRLRAVARLIAQTDALASLAEVADEGRYVRPELVDAPVLELEASRHPVIERMMRPGERFVPNDARLDADGARLMIVTGPNMAGKSTVMRQVAICTILAHVGSFVPARRARVGVCDRVFTRVGASDDIGRGQSTFMVEMVETATILEHATRNSLVILDEIGRGTSTFDGVSIAWSVAEHLHDVIACRAMFATHYHELTDLAVERAGISNASIAVAEKGDQ
ncbi:MAG: DNA mismatch repair protein MutS, partial [Myxococcota bacterium]